MEDKCCNVVLNETITDLRYDAVTGDLVYRNEGYHLQGDGETRINVKDMADNINLEDLGNVDDRVKKGCGILAHRSSCKDCGECRDCPDTGSCEHEWYNWQAKDNVATTGLKYLAGFTAEGCLVAIPAPESGFSTIVGRNGKWEIDNVNLPPGVPAENIKVAYGNINLFGQHPDGNSFIRTNDGATENDLFGGI